MDSERQIKGCGQSQKATAQEGKVQVYACPITHQEIRVYPDGTSEGCEGCHGYIDPFID